MSHCPYIFSPKEDCHCVKPGSLGISLTLKYCCGSFERCEIFREDAAGQGRDDRAVLVRPKNR